MATILLEVILEANEAAAVGIESRDEVEDPLESALADAGVGEVTGGGGGSGLYIVDVEIGSEEGLAEAVDLIRGVLRNLKVPASTQIKRHKPEHVFSVYGD